MKIRDLFFHVPKPVRRILVLTVEAYWLIKSRRVEKDNRQRPDKPHTATPDHSAKKNILFYHIDGLGFGGTEKFLQIIAKHISKEEFNVFYLTGKKPGDQAKKRDAYLQNADITMLTFDYESVVNKHPFEILGMNTDFVGLLRKHKIDAIVTPTSGHTVFPVNLERNIPIVLINIFGSFTAQKNIRHIIHISKEVERRSNLVSDPRIGTVIYIPSESPLPASEASILLRKKNGIRETDFVFGRIGRASDDIFDPIALTAFSEFQEKYVHLAPHTHYLIMSPSPNMIKMVDEKQIPNVHFVDSSAREEDVFAFHRAIDCLAHARLDGETCGLNIAESMLCANPILSHASHVWNAHLEYLDRDFSRIAPKDDSGQYLKNMHEFACIFFDDKETWKHMKLSAEKKARSLFLIDSCIGTIQSIIRNVLVRQ